MNKQNKHKHNAELERKQPINIYSNLLSTFPGASLSNFYNNILQMYSCYIHMIKFNKYNL